MADVVGGAKVEELDCVGFGWTGPRLRSEAASWGSNASDVMANR